tara:strand:- start:3213 stop:3422 length:210 start_codon:yes stop_codon:yes gene_type:complete
MNKTKFILTLSNDKVPVIAEVESRRVLENDEKVLGRACVMANVKAKNFIDITKKANYTEGKLYAHADYV